MSGGGSLIGRLIGLCIQFLICALAIYWAVKLLEAVWLTVVLILIGVGALVGLIGWICHYRRGW